MNDHSIDHKRAKQLKILYFFFIGFLLVLSIAWAKSKPSIPSLSQKDARRIGMQIWQNECSGKKEKLTSWNEGEEFASLGIGHFIWYPSEQTGDFKETFPSLVAYMESNHAAVPAWIKNSKGCPWPTRIEFIGAQQDPRMQELREWLFSTFELQTQFIINRLHKSLPSMIRNLSSKKRFQISHQFNRLAVTPAGLYALIDYLNFKGEGISKSESYQGHGWGLLQVLSRMKGSAQSEKAVEEFVESAKYILNQRIKHAPPNRKEERWRQGWFNRLDTYLRY